MNSKWENMLPVTMVAGAFFFLLAFGTLGVLPWLMTDKVAPIVKGADFDRVFMPAKVPLEFREKFADVAAYKKAVFAGRDIYIAEACWHCHSQYVRPVGNEIARYGATSENWEYQNEMNLPQLFGTRRVGPDLLREGGKRTNDWHFAHFLNPNAVVPESVMPRYDWFFDKNGKPNEKGWAIVAYVQWLGSWRKEPPVGGAQ